MKPVSELPGPQVLCTQDTVRGRRWRSSSIWNVIGPGEEFLFTAATTELSAPDDIECRASSAPKCGLTCTSLKREQLGGRSTADTLDILQRPVSATHAHKLC